MMRVLALGSALLTLSLPAYAGMYADDLSRCLVEKTTAADKNALVRWVIATTTLHPAVQSLANVSVAERTRANRETALLFERLLTESCIAQTRQAAKYEGAAALQTGFQTLGQVAMAELFANPDVAKGLGELDKLIDAKKLQQALQAD
ncbi:MAG: hypothetical protein A2X71_09910 [Thiobacillus sp. GWE1_62_9]|nr:MAG: hypothetical protein A2X71_09910 [Thiobacillus sp. GWE1_62_9]HBU29115.1 hypothetical protein [Thiobacillus sp.]